MVENQLRRGIALAIAGKNEEAKNILSQVVQDDPRSATAWFWLARVVETEEQQRYCLEKTLRIDPQNEAARQVLAQMKPQTANETQAPPPRKTIPTHSEDTKNFRKVVASAFGSLESEFYYAGKSADKGIEGQPLLLDICQEILSASFGIFDLSLENHNAYLEMGIALGLNRPVVATAREQSSLPVVLDGHNVIMYSDYPDLEAKLSKLCEWGFPPTAQPAPDYCYFCDLICESMSVPPDENSYLVLNRSKLLWRDLMQSLTPHLAEYHLHPVYLTDRNSGPRLCDAREKVITAQFVLCHLGALSDENSFLALGMAIGSRVPWILLSKKGRDSVPSDLRGVDTIEYTTLDDLEDRLTETLGTFLGRVVPGPVTKNDKTSLLSLPFWVQLDDWIDHISSRPAQATETIQGRVKVVQYQKQDLLSQRTVPGRGLLFGRGTDCDMITENQSVSSRHFRILKGRTGKYFVEDLHSKNGTFLNGRRLSPGSGVEISPGDTIRIPGARFLIWDDRPLPPEQTSQVVEDTSELPPTFKIEIPDVHPPTYLSTWEHPLTLTILLPDGHHHSVFEIQAYYPMGRILSEVVDLLDLPQKKYRFRIRNKLIDNNETPLSIGIKRGDVLTIVQEE